MDYEQFMEKLRNDGDYNCTCYINPPCSFCTDTVGEMYEEYCLENNIKPVY